MVKKNTRLITLFFTMLKVGAFTFGGGYAMVPLLHDEFVNRKNWVDDGEITDVLALSQTIPGAIAINSAIMIGYRLRKIAGALTAVLGIALPSVVSLTVVTYLYEAFRENIYVAGALRGIRACVVALLIAAFVRLSGPFRKDWAGILLFTAAFVVSIVFEVNSIFIILGGVMAGFILLLIERKRRKC